MDRKLAITAIILIVLGVVLGAFGAHGLKDIVAPEKIASYEVGVRYQIYHGLALLVIALNAKCFDKRLKLFNGLILAGVVLFSGSIYLLALNEVVSVDLKFLGPVTPIGGVLMIMGWGVLLRQFLKMKVDK